MSYKVLFTASQDEQGTIIITPAEGVSVRVEQAEKKTDYSHLVGKWVRYTHKAQYCNAKTGKWYRVIDAIGGTLSFATGSLNDENGWYNPGRYFDLSDPRDTNPDQKPHQLKGGDAVECTPEQRAEIIRVADECGLTVAGATRGRLLEYPTSVYSNLFWGRNHDEIFGLKAKDKLTEDEFNWHTVPHFISKMRWKAGDFLRVQTRNGKVVDELTYFRANTFCFAGVIARALRMWDIFGLFNGMVQPEFDLMLVVKGGEK